VFYRAAAVMLPMEITARSDALLWRKTGIVELVAEAGGGGVKDFAQAEEGAQTRPARFASFPADDSIEI